MTTQEMPQTAAALQEEGTPVLHMAGAVATVWLRRPSERNSLRDADLRTLLQHMAQVDADLAVRVLVLRACPTGRRLPVFCAGYNVRGFDPAAHDPRLFEHVADALEALRPVTVCALSGSVHGGATDLVLGCDLCVALAGSTWHMPAAALGLHYYPSGLRRYVSRLGVGLAKRAFLGAQPLPMAALDQAGLLHAVVPAQEFDAAVQALAQDVAALAPLAAQATKRSLGEIAAGRFDASALRAREAATLASADFAEGRTAFAERRAPCFTGH